VRLNTYLGKPGNSPIVGIVKTRRLLYSVGRHPYFVPREPLFRWEQDNENEKCLFRVYLRVAGGVLRGVAFLPPQPEDN